MKHGVQRITISTVISAAGIRLLAAVLSLCLWQPARAEPATANAPANAQANTPQAAPAHTPDTAQAREHYLRGERLFALGRFGEAMAAYEAAYELSSLPELLFNIGQCHRNLGNYESAVFSFQQFLKHKPEAPNREAVRALIQELETAMADADAGTRGNLVGAGPVGPEHAPGRSRWWLWSGAVAVAVTATLVTVWLTGDSDIPGSDLGNLDFEHDRKRISSRRARDVLLGIGHELRW